jgi:hypothetical protein
VGSTTPTARVATAGFATVNLLAGAGVAHSRGSVGDVAAALAAGEDRAADLLGLVGGSRELVAAVSVSSLDRVLGQLAARDLL